jgi:N-acetylneuraminic acid mutarotase
MIAGIKARRWLRVGVPGMAFVLLTACGGGGGGGSTASVATYAMTATAGTGGTISPSSAMVNSGATTTLTVTPSSGYAISSVTGCGGTLSGDTYTTGSINAACTVTASFVAQYAVTATAGTGGSIAPSTATVDAGATTTLTVAPKSGYVISSVTGCGGSLSGSSYTTGDINADCTVTANFSAAFTWVGGPDTIGGKGIYGTQGVTAATNIPGARDESCAWTDASGNVWLFGGEGLDSTGTWGEMNDLWKFSESSHEWTWIDGPTTVNTNGVYGAKGVPAATNLPAPRRTAACWADGSGNLWLFGGFGPDATKTYGYFNDLWEYSPSSGEWTWVGGSSTVNAAGVWGTQGIAAAGNVPGARANMAAWTDAAGTLWLLGGEGVDSNGTQGWLNDLWTYSPSSGEWTWVGGSNTTDAKGVYGTEGVASPGNTPGARGYAAFWTDASGEFWLFGGEGIDSIGGGRFLNDLWKYSPSSGEWTWVGGSSTANAVGVWGTQGVAATTNVPGARDIPSTWTDASGNLWLFGGWGIDSTNATGDMGDLWKYSPSSGEWTWVAGASTVNVKGIYGTQGVAAVANVPGARDSGISWTDASGNLWLFGGAGYDSSGSARGNLDDLWDYPTK